jgi:hypothetical protein
MGEESMGNKVIRAGRWEITEAELQAQIKESDRLGKEAAATEPRATSAHYDRKSGRLVIDLSNGATLMLPVSLLQKFEGARAQDIADVEVMPGGSALHWEKLDADFSVPGLVAGVFGTRSWMDKRRKEWGRKGGRTKLEAKAAAARVNGAKGGRPRIKRA